MPTRGTTWGRSVKSPWMPGGEPGPVTSGQARREAVPPRRCQPPWWRVIQGSTPGRLGAGTRPRRPGGAPGIGNVAGIADVWKRQEPVRASKKKLVPAHRGRRTAGSRDSGRRSARSGKSRTIPFPCFLLAPKDGLNPPVWRGALSRETCIFDYNSSPSRTKVGQYRTDGMRRVGNVEGRGESGMPRPFRLDGEAEGEACSPLETARGCWNGT